MSPVLLTSPDLRQSRLSQSVRQEDHSCSHPLGRDRERQSTCGGFPRRRGRYPFRSYRGSHTQPTSVETFVGGGFAIPYGTSKSWVVEKRLTLSRRRPSASVPLSLPGPSLAFVPVEDERAEREDGDERKLPPPPTGSHQLDEEHQSDRDERKCDGVDDGQDPSIRKPAFRRRRPVHRATVRHGLLTSITVTPPALRKAVGRCITRDSTRRAEGRNMNLT